MNIRISEYQVHGYLGERTFAAFYKRGGTTFRMHTGTGRMMEIPDDIRHLNLKTVGWGAGGDYRI